MILLFILLLNPSVLVTGRPASSLYVEKCRNFEVVFDLNPPLCASRRVCGRNRVIDQSRIDSPDVTCGRASLHIIQICFDVQRSSQPLQCAESWLSARLRSGGQNVASVRFPLSFFPCDNHLCRATVHLQTFRSGAVEISVL